MMKIYDFFLGLAKPFVKWIGTLYMTFSHKKITGKHYYNYRDLIEPGTVLLTKTNGEFSNLINPTTLKHCGIYVGRIYGNEVCYVLEVTKRGVILTDLVSFLTSKDIVVGCKPKFKVDEFFINQLWKYSLKYAELNTPYDYYFRKDTDAFYCFELAATILISIFPQANLICHEIVKGKYIYNEETFLDPNHFDVVFDSREGV